jgi:hypothetical protein
MYARVARFEGGEAEAIRKSAQEINARAASGPPEGVPSIGFTLLTDPENGRGLAVGLFETEEDLRKGDEVLNSMDPPGEGMGKRTSVETYEVAVDIRA